MITEITEIKEIEKIVKEFNSLKDDSKRINYIKENSDHMMLRLDNDWTGVEFYNVSEELDKLLDYDNYNEEIYTLNCLNDYLGWSDGIIMILNWAGIHCECV